MSRNTKKGFLSLEAALFLPVFIIAILTIAFLIKVAGASEGVMNVMADEARKASMRSYIVEHSLMNPSLMNIRLAEGKGAFGVPSLKTYLQFFSYMDKEDLIAVRVDSNLKIRLPVLFRESVDISETILFRAFTGHEFESDVDNFDRMEEKEDSKIVWVFPKAGEKYHELSCSYIQVAARQGTLTAAIKKKYAPCTHCNPQYLALGSVIFYFESTGKAYHKGSCYTVNRYVISMELVDAEKKGYTPCSKCF